MKDFSPKGTGNSRFLKSSISASETWEQFRAKLIAGNAPVDFNGINVDGVNEVGTPLNKANLLSDETATALGLNPVDGASVDDALSTLFVEPVGTIKTTIRNDLSDKYLLCNGAGIWKEQYPDLHPFLTQKPNVPYNRVTVTENSGLRPNCQCDCEFLDGYNIVAYAIGYNVYIEYTTTPTETWDRKLIYTIPDNGFYPDGLRIKKLNGQYVVVITTSYSSSNYLYVCYSDTLGGTWNTVKFTSGNITNAEFTYGNGYYVYSYFTTNRILQYSTTINGPYTSITITGAQNGNLEFCNGYFVLSTVVSAGQSTTVTASVYYSVNPTLTTWTNKTIPTLTVGNSYHSCCGVQYLNGLYLVLVRNNSSAMVAYCTDIVNGVFTWNSNGIGSTILPSKLGYYNGYYYFNRYDTINYYSYYRSNDISSNFTTINVLPTTNVIRVFGVCYGNDYYTAIGVVDSPETQVCKFISYDYCLPTITTTNAYNYVRATL